MFLDIVQPLNEDKKSILKDTKVSNDEIKIQNEIDDQIGEIITTWNTLGKVESIDEEQKKLIKSELIYKLVGIKTIDSKKEDKEEADHDQL